MLRPGSGPRERRPFAALGPGGPGAGSARPASGDRPGRVHGYNSQLNESCYLLLVGDNSEAVFRYLGIDEA